MLERSSQPGAEEWAIHDYEGFGGIHLSEYEQTDTIARIRPGWAQTRTGLRPLGGACWHPGEQEWTDSTSTTPGAGTRWRTTPSSYSMTSESIPEGLGPEMLRRYTRLDIEAFARDPRL
ncbi:MAG: antirestriction protein ArdA [Candidatus Microthrix sp.]|nr:antirestriction protein ArdA [Candidatus Microthrix sp.]